MSFAIGLNLLFHGKHSFFSTTSNALAINHAINKVRTDRMAHPSYACGHFGLWPILILGLYGTAHRHHQNHQHHQQNPLHHHHLQKAQRVMSAAHQWAGQRTACSGCGARRRSRPAPILPHSAQLAVAAVCLRHWGQHLAMSPRYSCVHHATRAGCCRHGHISGC